MMQAYESLMPALPQHALITIHNEGAVNIPKSHLHVELS
jgi:hypothetical protein